jgi:hypothetical protein
MANSKTTHFSRAGKSCNERFSILKNTKEILRGVYKQPRRQELELPQQHSKPDVSSLADLISTESMHIETLKIQSQRRKERESLSFMFATQSRDDWYRTKVMTSQASKDKFPSVGWYDVNYSYVHR